MGPPQVVLGDSSLAAACRIGSCLVAMCRWHMVAVWGSSLVSAGVTSVVVVSWILSSYRVLSPLSGCGAEARLYVLQRNLF